MCKQLCIYFLANMLVGTSASGAATSEVSWPEIEQQVAWHREQVRLCGPLSAIRVLHLLGNPIDPERTLPAFYGTNPRGTTIRAVLTLCRKYHSAARLVHLPKGKWNRLATPCILIINQRKHAIVLESVSFIRQTAVIWDPSIMRSRVVPRGWLEERWGGDAIVFHRRPWGHLLLGLANLTLLAKLVRRHRKRRG